MKHPNIEQGFDMAFHFFMLNRNGIAFGNPFQTLRKKKFYLLHRIRYRCQIIHFVHHAYHIYFGLCKTQFTLYLAAKIQQFLKPRKR